MQSVPQRGSVAEADEKIRALEHEISMMVVEAVVHNALVSNYAERVARAAFKLSQLREERKTRFS